MAIQSCASVTLGSIDARCEGSIGGIKRILIANRDDVVFPLSATGTTGEIDEIVMKASTKFYEYKFRKNTGSYTSTMTSDDAIGNHSVTTEVTLQFTKAEAEKRMKIQSAINANAVVIIEDMYGQHIFLGDDNYVSVTNATMVSGTANTDLNGFTLTLTDISKELPRFIVSGFDVDSLLS